MVKVHQSCSLIVSICRLSVSIVLTVTKDDVSLLQNGEHNFSVSSVTMINGEDAATYLHKVSRQANFHDGHARFNSLFSNQAGLSLGNGKVLAFSKVVSTTAPTPLTPSLTALTGRSITWQCSRETSLALTAERRFFRSSVNPSRLQRRQDYRHRALAS